MKRPKSEAELCMESHLQELFPGEWVAEARFHPERKWKFDYAVARGGLAIELEGGIWVGGRHTRGSGFQRDLDKYNAAASRGWTVFRFSPADVIKGKDLELLSLWKNKNL